MLAVIKTGGKQYTVAKGNLLSVEKLEAATGQEVIFDQVLLIKDKDVTVGAPTIAGAVVTAQVVEQYKDDKVLIFKKRRRHNYRRKKGHRQNLTLVQIMDISLDGKKSAAPKAEKAAAASKAEPKAEKKAAEPAKKATAAPKAKPAKKETKE